jgi:hypothetical protein
MKKINTKVRIVPLVRDTLICSVSGTHSTNRVDRHGDEAANTSGSEMTFCRVGGGHDLANRVENSKSLMLRSRTEQFSSDEYFPTDQEEISGFLKGI